MASRGISEEEILLFLKKNIFLSPFPEGIFTKDYNATSFSAKSLATV